MAATPTPAVLRTSEILEDLDLAIFGQIGRIRDLEDDEIWTAYLGLRDLILERRVAIKDTYGRPALARHLRS